MSNLLTGLQPVQTVLDHLEFRAKKRVTLDVPTVADLQLRWRDAGSDNITQSGYYAKIDGVELRLSDGAMQTACNLIGAPPKHWNQYRDRSAFPQAMRNILDNPGRKSGGVIVRHDGTQLNAILDRNYIVKDAFELLGDFVESCHENIGGIKGILPVEEGSSSCSIWA